MGKELKVQTLLTGRVRQRGDSLTIGVELINAQDNSQLWGQQYTRKLADVFAVQEEIAKEVSQKLRLKLTGTDKEQLTKRPKKSDRRRYKLQNIVCPATFPPSSSIVAGVSEDVKRVKWLQREVTPFL